MRLSKYLTSYSHRLQPLDLCITHECTAHQEVTQYRPLMVINKSIKANQRLKKKTATKNDGMVVVGWGGGGGDHLNQVLRKDN